MIMFGQNIYFLIGLLICLGIAIFAVIAAWTGINVMFWRAQRKNADRQERCRKLDTDGRPLPPTGRGLCTVCGHAFDTIYHLPGGERLCPACYRRRSAAGGHENAPS